MSEWEPRMRLMYGAPPPPGHDREGKAADALLTMASGIERQVLARIARLYAQTHPGAADVSKLEPDSPHRGGKGWLARIDTGSMMIERGAASPAEAVDLVILETMRPDSVPARTVARKDHLVRALVQVERLAFGLFLEQMAEALGLPKDSEIEPMLTRARELVATVAAVRGVVAEKRTTWPE